MRENPLAHIFLDCGRRYFTGKAAHKVTPMDSRVGTRIWSRGAWRWR
jgi:hypothetical protein